MRWRQIPTRIGDLCSRRRENKKGQLPQVSNRVTRGKVRQRERGRRNPYTLRVRARYILIFTYTIIYTFTLPYSHNWYKSEGRLRKYMGVGTGFTTGVEGLYGSPFAIGCLGGVR